MKKLKTYRIHLLLLAAFSFVIFMGDSCDEPRSSDTIQRDQQERLLLEAAAQTGMPNVHNFRERKMLKMILEMRDNSGLVTYTYLENMNPTPIHGRTALGGKLTYMGESIGYGIPYATEYTSPSKLEQSTDHGGHTHFVMPQADPNGLFSPSSAEGTWVMLKNPTGNTVTPVYIEPRVVVSQFQFPLD